MTKRCNQCESTEFTKIDESHSLNIYVHTDQWWQCDWCGNIQAYGMAEDPERGFSFYVPDRNQEYEEPECPEHGATMRPTKLWAEEGALQFKCAAVTEDGEYCQLLETVEPDTID